MCMYVSGFFLLSTNTYSCISINFECNCCNIYDSWKSEKCFINSCQNLQVLVDVCLFLCILFEFASAYNKRCKWIFMFSLKCNKSHRCYCFRFCWCYCCWCSWYSVLCVCYRFYASICAFCCSCFCFTLKLTVLRMQSSNINRICNAM